MNFKVVGFGSLVLVGVGLGVYFGVFYKPDNYVENVHVDVTHDVPPDTPVSTDPPTTARVQHRTSTSGPNLRVDVPVTPTVVPPAAPKVVPPAPQGGANSTPAATRPTASTPATTTTTTTPVNTGPAATVPAPATKVPETYDRDDASRDNYDHKNENWGDGEVTSGEESDDKQFTEEQRKNAKVFDLAWLPPTSNPDSIYLLRDAKVKVEKTPVGTTEPTYQEHKYKFHDPVKIAYAPDTSVLGLPANFVTGKLYVYVKSDTDRKPLMLKFSSGYGQSRLAKDYYYVKDENNKWSKLDHGDSVKALDEFEKVYQRVKSQETAATTASNPQVEATTSNPQAETSSTLTPSSSPPSTPTQSTTTTAASGQQEQQRQTT